MQNDQISNENSEEIKQRLVSLEESDQVVILLAVESGSRAWGFESTDSDFDVRFIYVQRPESYLSIDLEIQPDVIERPIVDHIDLSGWDIRKALKLFQKSNPPLLEWLQSRLIYMERFSFANEVRKLLPVYYRREIASITIFTWREGISGSIYAATSFGGRNISMCCAPCWRSGGSNIS